MYFSRIYIFGDAHYIFSPFVTSSPTSFFDEWFNQEKFDELFEVPVPNWAMLKGTILHEAVQSLMNNQFFEGCAENTIHQLLSKYFWEIVASAQTCKN